MRASALMRALRRASSTPRIMSLLPSATEIVGGLGLEEHLVGVSHECDVAPTAERLRAVLEAGCERVTTSDIDPHALPQGEIDRRVKEALKTGGDGALYGVDAAAVARRACEGSSKAAVVHWCSEWILSTVRTCM